MYKAVQQGQIWIAPAESAAKDGPVEKLRVLVVDDERLIAWSLASKLLKEGYEVEQAGSGREALSKFASFKPQLVMLDICLPDMNGLDLLKRFKAAQEKPHVLMMTAYASADTALQALKDGAEDFFGKPFNIQAVMHVVKGAFEKSRIGHEAEISGKSVRKSAGDEKLVGNSPKMIQVFKMIKAAADADAKTVLVTGESGTGKELVAKATHAHSARAARPFIEVNCASIPEHLLENELFGHERGAYTDASRRHKGLFEMAEGGTLFLDEIGDMPFPMQAKILKVIETRKFRRLGGQEDVEANVRIVTATHQNLPRMVEEGRFRADLFFRLNVMNITLPPLRERAEDIEPLVQYFIETLNAEYGRDVERASTETLECLTRYNWPGNVRELRNCVERLMLMGDDKILSPQHLSGEITSPPACAAPLSEPAAFVEHIVLPASGISLEELEKLLIQLALKKSQGNQTKAARLLKTSRDTLRYRMKKFGLADCDNRDPTGPPP